MFKRRDKMACSPSLSIMHSCFYLLNTAGLVNVILVMCVSKNVWS